MYTYSNFNDIRAIISKTSVLKKVKDEFTLN